jgi:hypothetical protein
MTKIKISVFKNPGNMTILDITCIPAKNTHIFVLSFADPIFYPTQWLNISEIAIKIHLLAKMSKATKRRRCQQCGTSISSHSLESLLKHMESSAICKEAIKACESCLMKFPDESSLVKHMSLKKQCLDTYNMGLMDPSIALDQPITGDKNDVLSTVSYYTSSGQKRKKLTDSDHAEGNIYATYAFPYQPKKKKFH